MPFLYFCLLLLISIHALREEGDLGTQRKRRKDTDFYPRPPRGGRPKGRVSAPRDFLFLSTPSARRATQRARLSISTGHDFYPRPPRGGRPSQTASAAPAPSISIHALREEGDLCRSPSTALLLISIHALREEGDATSSISLMAASIFLSTPSARRATST